MYGRLFPLKGKLVTGGNVMDKTSERVPTPKPFVHPMMADSLKIGGGEIVAKRNASRAVKRAVAATS